MVKRNYFEILGVPYDASDKEIKDAYRFMLKKFHPDENTGRYNERASEQTKRITEAYEILSDPSKRERHLRELQAGGASSDDLEEAIRTANKNYDELRKAQEELRQTRAERYAWENMYNETQQKRHRENAFHRTVEQHMQREINSGRNQYAVHGYSNDTELGSLARFIFYMAGIACAAITLFLFYVLLMGETDRETICILFAFLLPIAGFICCSIGRDGGGIFARICFFEFLIDIIFVLLYFHFK